MNKSIDHKNAIIRSKGDDANEPSNIYLFDMSFVSFSMAFIMAWFEGSFLCPEK